MKHLTEPPDLTKIPSQFRVVIGRALEKDPQRRTPGAAQLLDEFRRARQGKPIAEEIPASHFVDVPRLERNAAFKPGAAAGPGQRNGNMETAHYRLEQNGAPQQSPRPMPVSAPPPVARSVGQYCGRFGREVRRNPWLAVVLAIGLWAVFARTPLGGAARIGFAELLGLTVTSFVVYMLVTKYVGGGQAQQNPATPAGRAPLAPPEPPKPVAIASPVVQPVMAPIVERKPVAPPPAPRAPQRPPSPDTRRDISWRNRLSDLSGAMTMAAIWSVAATAGASVLVRHLPGYLGVAQVLPNPAGLGLFGLTTVLGSWAILAATKFWEGSGIDVRQRRLVQTALGAAVGACAFWLHQTLLVDLSYQNAFSGIIQHVGPFNLLTDATPVRPALPAYVLYFATLFGIRRWWWLADSFRPKRFRISSLVLTGLVAFLIPAAFVFHQDWGVLWGTAIAAVVQLSAPWVPAKERAALMQAPANAARPQAV